MLYFIETRKVISGVKKMSSNVLEICKQLLDEYNENISPAFYIENFEGLEV